MSKKDAPDESVLFQDKIIEKAPATPSAAATEVKAKDAAADPEKIKNKEPELKDIIIVVDDSPANLTIICGLLKKLGYGSTSFRDPLLALQHIEGLDEENFKKVRAIFSDFAMPGMDGIALLKELRTGPRTKTMPFVMITSNTERENIKAAAGLKVNHYLLKPVTAHLISETCAKLFPGGVAFALK